MQVSIFKSARETTPQANISLGEVFESIKSGEHRQRVAWVRECWDNDDKEAWLEAKKGLPGVCWAGQFSTRNAKSCTAYTGLVVADIDHNDEPGTIRDALRHDEYCLGAFISPTGDGVKAIFATSNKDPAKHLAAYLSLAEYIKGAYAIELDESGKDVSRLCFLSSDPECWWKEPSALLPVDESHIEQAAAEPKRNEAGKVVSGDRHGYLCRVAAKVASVGCGIDVVRQAVDEAVSHCDVSDGRVFSKRELKDIAESAVYKYTADGLAEEAGLAEMREVTAGWLAAWQGAQDEAERTHTDPGPLPEITLPGIGGLWYDWLRANSYKWQPDLAIGNIIISAGSIIGKHLQTPGGSRSNLYGFGVAGTGEGKDAARECAKRLLVDAGAEDIIGPENIASDAGLINCVKLADDGRFPTLLQLDEAGYLLGAASGADAKPHLAGIIATLLELYTSSGSLFKGKAYGDTKRNLTIKNPHCSLWATTTPGRLWSSLTPESIEGGLLGRCLFFFGLPEMPTLTRPDPDQRRAPDELLLALQKWVHQPVRLGMLGDGAECRSVRVRADAQNILDEVGEWSEQKLRSLRGDPMAGLFVRVAQVAERVAMIYAWMADQWHPVIDDHAARFGALIARHSSLRLAAHASQNIMQDGSPFERRMNRMLAKLRKAGAQGCTRRQLQWHLKGLKSKEFKELLDTALESGTVQVKAQEGKSGARFLISDT